MADKAAKQAAEVDEAIAAMPDWERKVGERLHTVITESAPSLAPRLWYTQPAYAKDGKVICFFRGAAKDGERYVTFGFSGNANLDDGNMWPTAFAITGITAADEKAIAALVEQAVR